MSENLFESLQTKKQKLRTLAAKALEFGWIDATREQEIKTKLDNDVLTIGVIGQMKCGKSTFLNAFVFEEDVLPAATTPMTAALTVITYGPEKKLVAEFYTRDEWEEQKIQAKRDLSSVSRGSLEESKIKAAKDLVKQAEKLGSSLDSYLGKTQSDSFDKLIEYVGAEGKYVSITKAVTLYYPKEYLKGVEIVDTPGFNDPIVSREERTKAFLKKADVVLLMIYAGRPFDATDSNILNKEVRLCGAGQVILGINKYDIPYQNGETDEDIKNYVKEQLNAACNTCRDDLMKDLLKDTDPIPLSAQMALLSELPMSRITPDKDLSFYWNHYCDIFEIDSQRQLREKSHIDDLINAVKTVLEKEKEQILLVRPQHIIRVAADNRINELDNEIDKQSYLISTLNQPDLDLQKRLEDLNKIQNRLNRKIESAKNKLQTDLNEVRRDGEMNMDAIVDDAFTQMEHIIDDMGYFEAGEDLQPKFESALVKLSKALKKEAYNIKRKTKDQLKTHIEDLLSDIEPLLEKYYNDFDGRHLISRLIKEIDTEIEVPCLFSDDHTEESRNFLDYLALFLTIPIVIIDKLLIIKPIEKAINLVTHDSNQKKLKTIIQDMHNKCNIKEYINSIFNQKEDIVELIRKRLIDELLEPLSEQLNDIISKQEQRTQKLNESQILLETLQKEKAIAEEQLNSVRDLID